MSNWKALHFQGLTEVARRIEVGELSSVELTQTILDRIQALDGRLHSYITVMADHALSAARAADAEIRNGKYRGPLHGVPIAVKDLLYTKGVRTTGGLGPLVDFVPSEDATVVRKLEAAGAVLLGKLTTTEGGMAGYNPAFEVPINPWGDDLWPGVSSSGSGISAAAGLSFASIGSDTGGSIRFPAMCNGVVGLKPTYGRVSRHGVLVLADSLDHLGPLTRRTADAAVVLEAIAGYDAMDATSLSDPVPNMLKEINRGVEGQRIGFDRAWASDGVDSELVSAIEAALETLEALGAQIVDVKVPTLDELDGAWFTICMVEALSAHAATFPSRADEYGPYFRDFLEAASAVTEDQYTNANRVRAAFNERFTNVLGSVDAIAAPSGGVPFVIEPGVQRGNMAAFEQSMPLLQMQFTVPADFAGTPTLTLPCGSSSRGLPLSFQFMGGRLTEPGLCRIGQAFEGATEWHLRHPEI